MDLQITHPENLKGRMFRAGFNPMDQVLSEIRHCYEDGSEFTQCILKQWLTVFFILYIKRFVSIWGKRYPSKSKMSFPLSKRAVLPRKMLPLVPSPTQSTIISESLLVKYLWRPFSSLCWESVCTGS